MSTKNIHNKKTKVSCVCVAGACFKLDFLVQSSFGERTETPIENQIRYPSSNTHYYSCVMLSFFSETKDEGVKEQVYKSAT